MRSSGFRRAAIAAGGLALVPIGLVLLRWESGNFGVVEPGAIYRSAQLAPGGLEGTIRDYGVRSVVNLRGPNDDRPWYRAERAAAGRGGASLVDLSMASDHWLSREQARTVVEVLDRADRPILIHCEWGAERTGLVSAIATLLRPGSTLAMARSQFSPWYLFVESRDGLVMRGHLDLYEAYLRDRGESHSPERFRRWLLVDYAPRSPSREYWKQNPYPRLVVTPPGRLARRTPRLGTTR